MKDRLGTVLSTKEFVLLQYRTDIIFLQKPRYGVGPERKKTIEPPTQAPTSPTHAPTLTPTLTPTLHPTLTPTLTPTRSPTLTPTLEPATYVGQCAVVITERFLLRLKNCVSTLNTKL